tara:strand:- start:105 stop:452 length:348 start_codon:yes stop_codon:yes gene_type:complete
MKKTLLLLLCLFSLNTFTYASFPITENSASEISNAISFQVDDDEDEPSLLVYILRGVLFFLILGFGLYFLIKAWLRAWRDNVRWVKILTYIVLAALLLILLFTVLLSSIGYGYGN